MNQINEVVEHYLSIETDYALLITGPWGIGKTYYVNNSLKSIASETPTIGDQRKKYCPIVISLFGLNTMEDVMREIFLTLHPILRDKKLKLTATLGRAIFMSMFNFINSEKTLESFKKLQLSDYVKFNELLICFDDFERVGSKKLNKEILGFINKLVENDHVKVIIIANESKIRGNSYIQQKDKVIGASIEFVQDVNSIYSDLVEKRFKAFPEFSKFLSTMKVAVSDVFYRNSSNLRILAFALTSFQEVYSELMILKESNPFIYERESEVANLLFKFTLAISIEYRNGEISYLNRNSLDSGSDFDFRNFDFTELYSEGSKEINEENDYKAQFINKYFFKERFYFFESIFSFITGRSKLKQEDILSELKNYYYIKDDVVQPQYRVLEGLKYAEPLKLTDKEYKLLTRRMVKYAEEGKYDLLDYLSIYKYALRFNNPLGYNERKLLDRILKGMKRGIESHVYKQGIGIYIDTPISNNQNSALIQIREYIIHLNDYVFQKAKTEEAKALINLCFTDFNMFFERIVNKENYFCNNPLFNQMNPQSFYKLFINGNNATRHDVNRLFNFRFIDKEITGLKNELDFLIKLKEKLEIKIENIAQSGISYSNFKELAYILRRAIEKLEAI